MLKIGDRIAKITTLVGIPPCKDCKEWQDWLNKLTEKRKETKFPFGNPFESKDNEL